MKDKKELKQLKSRLGALDEKLAELNASDLEKVIGGCSSGSPDVQFDTNNENTDNTTKLTMQLTTHQN